MSLDFPIVPLDPPPGPLGPPTPGVMLDEDRQRLKNACGAGDLATAAEFLQSWKARGLDMEICNWALYDAVREENVQLAIFLIEHDVPFDPFLAYRAGQQKMFAVVSAAIDQGWDINTPRTSVAPPALRDLVLDYEATEWFLDHGASPNAHGLYDDTPLSFAVLEAPISTIQLLLDRGGDIKKGQQYHHAAWRATADSRLDVLQLLWDRGLSQSSDEINKVKYQDFPQMYQSNKYGGIGTPLHNAVRAGNLDTVKWLVEHGANPLIKDPMRLIPLQLAHELQKNEIAEYLAPISVINDQTTIPGSFTDLPANWVETAKEREQILIDFYKENDPSQLYEQDGRFHVRGYP